MFQIFLMLFSFLVIVRARRQYQHKRISRSWFFLWSCLWVVVFVAAAAPQTLDIFALWAGVGRGADLFVYVAILLLLIFVFRLLIKTNQLERQITQLVRKIAIEETKKEKVQQKPPL